MVPKPLIIVNNAAAKARRSWPIIKAKLKQSKLEFEVYETTRPGDATIETRTALKGGFSTIAVVGGDGTLSEAAEGFFEFAGESTTLPSLINSTATLAILPAGTGDDFARGLLGRRGALDRWIELFISHCEGKVGQSVRVVDVMHGICDGYNRQFICLNAATMGIGGETAARVAAQGSVMRRFSGEIRFAVAAVGALGAWRERPVRVSIDQSEAIEKRMNLVAVANGLYAGGGMMLSPKALVDDGKLDVITASGLTRATVIRELPRIHHGGHVANPNVSITQGKRVRIETFSEEDGLLIEADGNVRGKTPVEFRIMPGALRFVV
ncbi:MAG: diacylglycerol/lipid kinase family protein [Pyrinomonadaceae bacterium]